MVPQLIFSHTDLMSSIPSASSSQKNTPHILAYKIPIHTKLQQHVSRCTKVTLYEEQGKEWVSCLMKILVTIDKSRIHFLQQIRQKRQEFRQYVGVKILIYRVFLNQKFDYCLFWKICLGLKINSILFSVKYLKHSYFNKIIHHVKM